MKIILTKDEVENILIEHLVKSSIIVNTCELTFYSSDFATLYWEDFGDATIVTYTCEEAS